MSVIATVTFSNGEEANFNLNTADPHASVEFIPGEDNDTIDMIYATGLAGEPFTQAVFIDTCIPPNPVYVRWINRLGGYEYHMFDQNKSFTRTVNPTNYKTEWDWQHDNLRSDRTLSMDLEDTWNIGENTLTEREWRRLVGILTSPKISIWNVDDQQWEGAVIDKKTSVSFDSRNGRGEFGVILKALEQPIQF